MSSRIAVVRNPRALPRFSGTTAITIGNFDGVHLGHQAVLKKLTDLGTARSIVISFYPHPSVVLRRAGEIPALTPLHQKTAYLESLGVTVLLLVRFTSELSKIGAAEFLDRYFLSMLGATHAVIGPDTALGRNREGNRDFILNFLHGRGVHTESVSFLEGAGGRISSRRIRELLLAGEVAEAAVLLGRPYRLEGRVRRGEARGRTIGVPTANILAPHQVLPKLGVYASKVRIDGGSEYGAVTNIGVRPTFGGISPSIESHIFSFSDDLYGKRIEVSLVGRIRDEMKFSGIDQLKAQIQLDIETAKKLVPT